MILQRASPCVHRSSILLYSGSVQSYGATIFSYSGSVFCYGATIRMNSRSFSQRAYIRAHIYSLFMCPTCPICPFSAKRQGHMGQMGHLFSALTYYRARARTSLHDDLPSVVDIEALLRGLVDALAANSKPLVVTVIGYCFTVIVLDSSRLAEDDRHGLRL